MTSISTSVATASGNIMTDNDTMSSSSTPSSSEHQSPSLIENTSQQQQRSDEESNKGTTKNQQQQQQQPQTRAAAAAATDSSSSHNYNHAKRMICGGAAGMVAKTATNPLERIKMLSQTGEGGAGRGTWAIYRQILRSEGAVGLWAGNGANLLRIFPSKAVVFSSHDFYKSLFRKYFVDNNSNNTNNTNKQLPSLYSFLAGGLAGVTATAVTYPLDLARGRISGKLAQQTTSTSSATTTTTTKAYTGIWQTIATTVQDEGVRGLYKGVTPTLLGAMPYVGIQFGTVGLLERLFPLSRNDSNGVDSKDEQHPKTESQHHSTPLRKMVFGGLGGMTAGLLTYPNDTVRRLLQLQGSRGTATHYAGYWDCVRQTYRSEGVARFYRGLTVNLIRMAPNTAVQFGTYELLKQWTGTQ